MYEEQNKLFLVFIYKYVIEKGGHIQKHYKNYVNMI